jgi:hypothetical protein
MAHDPQSTPSTAHLGQGPQVDLPCMQAAQLKERPGRRLWEEAPEFLKLTAHTQPEITATRKQSVSDKLQLCRKLKQEGNQLYEQVCTYVCGGIMQSMSGMGELVDDLDMPSTRILYEH